MDVDVGGCMGGGMGVDVGGSIAPEGPGATRSRISRVYLPMPMLAATFLSTCAVDQPRQCTWGEEDTEGRGSGRCRSSAPVQTRGVCGFGCCGV